MYPNQLQKNYNSLKNKNFYLQIDGSQNRRCKNIYNVIGGVLTEKKQGRGILLESFELESGRAENIVSIITYVVAKIHQNHTPCTFFKLFITDGAASCLKAGAELKILFKSLKHVTCIAHFTNNLASKILELAPLVKKMTGLFVKVFQKTSKKKKIFRDLTFIKIEKSPVDTRFGTFFKYAIFLYDNWQSIVGFLDKDLIDSESFKKAKLFLSEEKENLENELLLINVFRGIVDIIAYVEGQNLLVTDVYSKIKTLESLVEQHETLKNFCNKWLHEKGDNHYFYNYTPLNCNADNRIYSYAPLSSIDCERSFSAMNFVISDKKTELNNTYAFALLIIYYNNNKLYYQLFICNFNFFITSIFPPTIFSTHPFFPPKNPTSTFESRNNPAFFVFQTDLSTPNILSYFCTTQKYFMVLRQSKIISLEPR